MNNDKSFHDFLPHNPRQPWSGQQGAPFQDASRTNPLITEIRVVRKSLLDAIEIAYGDTNAWPRVRALILRSLGKSGIEGVAHAMLNHYSDKEVDHDKKYK